MSRPSHVRNALHDLIRASDRHDWSADEILEALREQAISADFSSVCRGLAYLEERGVVRRVHLGDGKARYEADDGHHDHVRCNSCGAVAEIPGCMVPEAQRAVHAATGFQITGHQLLFFGVCGHCAQQQGA
jgi:Fe2+ or Zn2+ uptake regulation protein